RRLEDAWQRPGGSNLVGGCEPTTGCGRNVERLEDAIADEDHADLFRLAHSGHGRKRGGPYAQRLERPVLLGVSDIHGWRETKAIRRTPRSRGARRHLPQR